MPSANIEYNFLDRGFSETLLLLPGWATDCRIFTRLNLDYNYLLSDTYFFLQLEKEFPSFLKHYNLHKVSLLGWSLGGFTAYHLGLRYPEKIKEITLAGIRKKYPREAVNEMREAVQKNKKAALYQFYKNCFSRQERDIFKWFKKNLIDQYVDEFQIQYLLDGLDYLEGSEISPATSYPVPLRFIHGQNDTIAPIQEAIEIADPLPQSQFSCIEGAGHCVFLHPRFSEMLKEP